MDDLLLAQEAWNPVPDTARLGRWLRMAFRQRREGMDGTVFG